MADHNYLSPRAQRILRYINTHSVPQPSFASSSPQQDLGQKPDLQHSEICTSPLESTTSSSVDHASASKTQVHNRKCNTGHTDSFAPLDVHAFGKVFYEDELGKFSQSVLDALDAPFQSATTPDRSRRHFANDNDMDSKSDDYAMADPVNSWNDDDLLALGNISQDNLTFAPVDVDYDEDDETAIRLDEEHDVPVRKRCKYAPPRLFETGNIPRNAAPISRQSTTETFVSSTPAAFSPGPRSAVKRRYSDLDTDVTSSGGSSPSPTPSPRKSPFSREEKAPVYMVFDQAALKYLALLPITLSVEASHLAEDCKIGWGVVSTVLQELCRTSKLFSSVSSATAFLYTECIKHSTNIAAHIRSRYDRIFPVLPKLDFEVDTLRQDPFGGLGNTGTQYGGCVQFAARLSRIAGSKELSVTLNEPAHGPSTRFTRRFGSDRLIRLHVDLKHISQRDTMEFCERPFILGPYVYRPIFAKDSTIFLVRFDESLEELGVPVKCTLPSNASTKDFKFTISTFFKWFNDPDINKHQTMGKWAARMALLFSDSVPGPRFEKSNIFFIEDICAPHIGNGKAATEKIMTDGCGYANRAVFERVKAILNLDSLPGAIQFRCAGAKGLLIRHPRDFDRTVEPQLWIRNSMNKIHYAEFQNDKPLDAAMLTLDIIRTSNVTPAKSSAETIVNMGCNGVHSSIFATLFQNALDSLVESLTNWDKERIPDLCVTLERLSGRVSRNKARILGNEARARGVSWGSLGEGLSYEVDVEDDKGEGNSGPSEVWEDQIVQQLRSGFHPNSCPILAYRLERLIVSEVNKALKKFRIELPLSATAFIAPDPYGVLGEGEIFFRPSDTTMRLQDLNGIDFRDNVLNGPVLVTRHPCKLPTDVQKVKAVSCKALEEYRDVILFSIQGEQSLASLLGGGDYDGDTVNIIWHPEIVTPFKNAPIEYSRPPDDLSKYFEKQPLTVEKALETKTFSSQLIKFLLAPLDQRCPPGGYSILHDKAVYEKGYTHEFTRLMAFMFCELLDSGKTGKRIVAGKYEWHSRQVSKSPPGWKSATSVNNEIRSFYPSFIMDELVTACTSMIRKHILAFKNRLQTEVTRNRDPALWDHWKQRRDQAKKFKEADEEVAAVEAHIRAVHKEWKAGKDRFILAKETRARPSDGGPATIKSPSRAANRERDSVLIETPPLTINAEHRRICRLFAARPKGLGPNLVFLQEATLALDKASCAYYLAYEGPDPKKSNDRDTSAKFAFEVAMQELCALKALACGQPYEVATEPFVIRSKMYSV